MPNELYTENLFKKLDFSEGTLIGSLLAGNGGVVTYQGNNFG